MEALIEMYNNRYIEYVEYTERGATVMIERPDPNRYDYFEIRYQHGGKKRLIRGQYFFKERQFVARVREFACLIARIEEQRAARRNAR